MSLEDEAREWMDAAGQLRRDIARQRQELGDRAPELVRMIERTPVRPMTFQGAKSGQPPATMGWLIRSVEIAIYKAGVRGEQAPGLVLSTDGVVYDLSTKGNTLPRLVGVTSPEVAHAVLVETAAAVLAGTFRDLGRRPRRGCLTGLAVVLGILAVIVAGVLLSR